jgi:hypothetical protein
MNVLCVGMYRACSTWQYEVAADLVERFHGGRRLGFVQSFDYGEQFGRKNIGNWHVIKAHEGGPAFRSALQSGGAIALYAVRDVRDVVYSMLHKRRQQFDAFLRQGMIHQILANDFYWIRQPTTRLLTQRYEAIVEDPARAVREIASHLNIAITAEGCAAIAERYSFQANLERVRAAARRMDEAGIDRTDPANAVCYDDHSLLHWNHLRDGRVGSWREAASIRERAILWFIAGRWLIEHGYANLSDSEDIANLSVTDYRWVAEGWAACRLRCASLQFPRLAKMVKRTIGLTSSFEAKPIRAASKALPTDHTTRSEAA